MDTPSSSPWLWLQCYWGRSWRKKIGVIVVWIFGRCKNKALSVKGKKELSLWPVVVVADIQKENEGGWGQGVLLWLSFLIRSHATLARTQKVQLEKTYSFKAYINTPTHSPDPSAFFQLQQGRGREGKRRMLGNLKGSTLINSWAFSLQRDFAPLLHQEMWCWQLRKCSAYRPGTGLNGWVQGHIWTKNWRKSDLWGSSQLSHTSVTWPQRPRNDHETTTLLWF